MIKIYLDILIITWQEKVVFEFSDDFMSLSFTNIISHEIKMPICFQQFNKYCFSHETKMPAYSQQFNKYRFSHETKIPACCRQFNKNHFSHEIKMLACCQ